MDIAAMGGSVSVKNYSEEIFPPKEKGIFPSRDGTKLYYEVRGNGKPLVLCYGLTCRMEHWRYQLEYFARRYEVYTLDYRGHHRSGMPANERHLTLEWCAKDVEDLIRHRELSKPVVFGHSMGVPVLVLLANLVPELLSGLVFVCGTVDNPFKHMFHSDKLDHVFRRFSKLYEIAPNTMTYVWKIATRKNPVNFFLTSQFGFNPSLSDEKDVLMYMEGVHQCPLVTFRSLLHDYSDFNGRDYLRRIQLPTLVIAGENDWITPLNLSEEMATLVSHSQLEKIPDGSHNSHMDLPGVVNRRIDDFLKELKY